MRTLIYFGHRQLNHYNFSRIEKIVSLNKILVIGNTSYKNASKQILNCFNEVFIVNETCDEHKILCELDYIETTRVLKTILQKGCNPILITHDEACVLLVAKLRTHFNLPGAQENEIKPFRDKIKMKNIALKAGIKVPRHALLQFKSDKSYYSSLVNNFGNLFILKPTNSAGTSNVNLIQNFDDFRAYINRTKNSKHIYEVEEYIQGELFHVDTLIKDKKIQFSACSILNLPCLEFKNGYPMSSFPLLKKDKRRSIVEDFACKILKAFGYPDGIHHTEIFMTSNNELYFLESGARAPGLSVIPIYESTYGINMLTSELMLNLGIKTDLLEKNNYHTFYIIWPTKKGKLRKNDLPKINGIHQIKWHYEEGEKLISSSNNLGILAEIIVTNKYYEDAKKDFDLLTTFEIAQFIK